ncbi:MAG: hypothetical protein KAX49_03170 [Halanaerobiales bacterium]|nr:hypothetical protein [Halanaerobiales bacterium]
MHLEQVEFNQLFEQAFQNVVLPRLQEFTDVLVEKIEENRREIRKNRKEIEKNREMILENRKEIEKNREMILENRVMILENREMITENKVEIHSLSSRMDQLEKKVDKNHQAVIERLDGLEANVQELRSICKALEESSSVKNAQIHQIDHNVTILVGIERRKAKIYFEFSSRLLPEQNLKISR